MDQEAYELFLSRIIDEFIKSEFSEVWETVPESLRYFSCGLEECELSGNARNCLRKLVLEMDELKDYARYERIEDVIDFIDGRDFASLSEVVAPEGRDLVNDIENEWWNRRLYIRRTLDF